MKFKEWINENMTGSIVGDTNNAATDATVIMPRNNYKADPTVRNNNAKTDQQTSGSNQLNPQHPEITKSTRGLEQIQNGLTNIFKRLSTKPFWKNPQLRQAFGDKITKSWTHAGQAKSILCPIGNEDDI